MISGCSRGSRGVRWPQVLAKWGSRQLASAELGNNNRLCQQSKQAGRHQHRPTDLDARFNSCLPHLPLLKRGAQRLLRRSSLGRQQQPASGLIQPVHVPRPVQRANLLRRLQRVRQQGEHTGQGCRAAAGLAQRCKAAAAAGAGAAAFRAVGAAAAAAPGWRVAGYALGLDHACHVLILVQHLQLHPSACKAGRVSGHSTCQPIARRQLHRRARPLHALQHLAAGQRAAAKSEGGSIPSHVECQQRMEGTRAVVPK